MSWLAEYAASAQEADRFRGKANHAQLLGAGLMGEAGSVLSELKKAARELNAYPVYRRRMEEELGDLLWYFVRLVAVVAPTTLEKFAAPPQATAQQPSTLPLFLELGSAAGELTGLVAASSSPDAFCTAAERMWTLIQQVAKERKLALPEVATQNLKKIKSRWPGETRQYHPLFDDAYGDEERLPRTLEIEFRERGNAVILRCNGLNFGDRVTDNIRDRDGYRFHDVFHFAYAVHLGWSPVLRALFRCKRKSKTEIDEAQDGARATIVEEAVSAIVFSRAKQLAFFDGLDHVDYDLLKIVSEHVQGYEVDEIPLWQWEVAIIEGYRIFRQLLANHGGSVLLDLTRRELGYHAPLRP